MCRHTSEAQGGVPWGGTVFAERDQSCVLPASSPEQGSLCPGQLPPLRHRGLSWGLLGEALRKQSFSFREKSKEAFSSLSVPVIARVTKTAEPASFWGLSPGSGMASGKDSRGAWCSSLGSGLSREAGVLRMAQSHLEFLRGQSEGRNTVCVYPESSLGGTLPRS